jgi:ketopantoate hydroxymethyltransferase
LYFYIFSLYEFSHSLGHKQRTQSALRSDRLLAIAPALEAAGVAAISMEEINAEVKGAQAMSKSSS